jgi:phosphoribosylformylglycinamidine cyclo-ligase
VGNEPTYGAAGVSLATAGAVVERLRAAVESTGAQGFGAFAGLYPLDERRLLAASMDSIGTKPMVARERGLLRNCGADMAAHCINDVATTGADPLFLLDYVAAGRLDLDQVAELVEGAAGVCRKAGCALVGGETAEMPGMYALGDYDLAGFIVGVVDAGADRAAVKEGDLLVGLPSNGLHTNGYSLARKVFEGTPLTKKLADQLLAPHTSYLDAMRSLRWKAAAHITGGGILGNLPRCLPEGLGAVLDRKKWEAPPIFGEIQRRGRVSDDEMYGTFNMGLGMILVVDAKDADPGSLVVGDVVEQKGPERVVLR